MNLEKAIKIAVEAHTGQVDKGGIWGVHPDLGDLVEGDMKFTMDYRSVYASILSDWFKIPLNRFSEYSNENLLSIYT